MKTQKQMAQHKLNPVVQTQFMPSTGPDTVLWLPMAKAKKQQEYSIWSTTNNDRDLFKPVMIRHSKEIKRIDCHLWRFLYRASSHHTLVLCA